MISGGDEGHEAGAAEELGNEKGGVALLFGAIDPVDACSQRALLAAALAQHPAAIAAHAVIHAQPSDLLPIRISR